MFDAEIEEKSRDLIVLERAREKIARGWCQNRWRKDGAVCIVGAIADAIDDVDQVAVRRGHNCTHWIDLMDALGAPRADAIWNDARGRTQAEVLARFDSAIARLSAQPAGRG